MSLLLLVGSLCICAGLTNFQFTWGYQWDMPAYRWGYSSVGLGFAHAHRVSDAEAAAALDQINAALAPVTSGRYDLRDFRLYPYDDKDVIATRLLRIFTADLKFYPHTHHGYDFLLPEGPPLGRYVDVHISWWVPPAICGVLLLTSGRVLIRRFTKIVAGRCQRCSYDLTANTSGVCPECGMQIEAGSVPQQKR